MGFWVFALGLTLLVVAVLGRALLRGRAAPQAEEMPGITLYREQLAGVAKDAEAGRIAPEEAGRLELEIKRRILEADRAKVSESAEAPRGGSRALAAVLAVALFGGAAGLYAWLGVPGYRDVPITARLEAAAEYRANRPGQATAEARFAESMPAAPDPQVSEDFHTLMEQLRTAVAERPDDLQGHALLMRNELSLGNYSAAAKAQEGVVRIKGPETTTEDFVVLAELWISAAGGYVSPEAEAALRAALARDESNMTARYYWGLMQAQTGRADIAFRVWRGVLADLPEDAPWAEDLPRQIAAAAAEAGVDYTPTAPTRGPSEADVKAAGEMTAEDRAAMIQGMVEGLSDELATEGGPPEKWAQLIRALGVLGETEQQSAIAAEARALFADNAEALALIEAAAGVQP